MLTPPWPRPRGPGQALIEQIVPQYVACADTAEDLVAELMPGEHEHVARAVPARRAEFVTGRACARAALARLGLPPSAIPPGDRGEPVWPDGVVGSITHCDGYRGAVAAMRTQAAGLGIDAEPNKPLTAGVLDAICLPQERFWVDRLRAAHSAVCWDRLLFCAKESVYKAWYPLVLARLDFEDAAISVDVERGRFTAVLPVAGPVVGGRELTELSGRWAVREHLILTAVAIDDPSAGRPQGTNGAQPA